MTRKKLVAAICATVAIAGCSKESQTGPNFEQGYGVVHVYAVDSVYAAGSSIQFAVENVGPTDLTYGSCARFVERMAGTSWVLTDDFHIDNSCNKNLFLVFPGQIGDGSVTLRTPTTVGAGTYRIRIDDFGIWGDSSKRLASIYSDAFSIRAEK